MTCKEAHEYLENMQREFTKHRRVYADNLIEANGKSIEALEKQIPKKPLYDTEWDCSHTNYRCPNCGGDSYCIMYDNNLADNYNYCNNCGQALDWSDAK